jgi:hypothetical protein
MQRLLMTCEQTFKRFPQVLEQVKSIGHLRRLRGTLPRSISVSTGTISITAP